ncbi:hypothetical protein B0T20DRAFT_511801 [Sordaria brevicollis]|uniref:Uncharacterized protein n=1 Tax=Sordaria brevicollis TaxID=83679 RepID=A0AAE0NRE1_SORBR|nr:hypothetical protein B0T20DRAFT_511801 [Sordaria brevicollis]
MSSGQEPDNVHVLNSSFAKSQAEKSQKVDMDGADSKPASPFLRQQPFLTTRITRSKAAASTAAANTPAPVPPPTSPTPKVEIKTESSAPIPAVQVKPPTSPSSPTPTTTSITRGMLSNTTTTTSTTTANNHKRSNSRMLSLAYPGGYGSTGRTGVDGGEFAAIYVKRKWTKRNLTPDEESGEDGDDEAEGISTSVKRTKKGWGTVRKERVLICGRWRTMIWRD